jgi:hypothetical protein
MAAQHPGSLRVRAGRTGRTILDIAWHPGLSLTQVRGDDQRHDAVYCDWEVHSNPAKHCRALAEKAAATEQLIV